MTLTPRARGASPALTLTAMGLGFAVVQLDVTVVNVALGTIGASFGSGNGIAGLQWVVNAYTLVFASLILTAGALGDRFGAKRLFIGGFVLFVAASMACGAAPSLAILIIARALQGIGAAVLVPGSLALLNHTYREPAARSRAAGIWAGVASIALAGGPVVGGALIASVGWRAIFFLNLPLGLAGIWLTARYADETEARPHPLDPPGQASAIIAVAALAEAMIEAGGLGWSSLPVLGGFALFVATAAFFLVAEARSRHAMLPLAFFRNRTFAAACGVGLLINIAFYGLIFDLSLFFQRLQHLTPLQTGLAFVPMTGIVLAANIFAGRAAGRFGARPLMVAGQLLSALGCLGLLGVEAKTAYGALAWPTLLIGGGIGLTVPPMTSALLGTVDRARSGIASGVLNTVRQVGSVVGVALFGTLIATPDRFVAGLHAALAISLGLGVLGAAVALLWLREAAASDRRDEASVKA